MVLTSRRYHYWIFPRDQVRSLRRVVAGITIRIWSPSLWRIFPACCLQLRRQNRLFRWQHVLFWWLHRHFCWWRCCRRYQVLLIFEGERLVHYSVLRSADYRFPFMAENDGQVGPVWTCPAARGRGLASAALFTILEMVGAGCPRVWWVCLTDNLPSNAVARRCGFLRLGEGRRVPWFGARILGRFVIDRVVSEADPATCGAGAAAKGPDSMVVSHFRTNIQAGR